MRGLLAVADGLSAAVRRGAPAAERDGTELQARALASAVSGAGTFAAFN
jgi:hypothetical protein